MLKGYHLDLGDLEPGRDEVEREFLLVERKVVKLKRL